MKKETQIDRKSQGQNEVIMTDMPKSGFNLTHNNYFGGLVLGRLIPIVYQWLMPNDKFSGSNQHMLTFEQLATPVLSDVNVSMHNFYCTLRAVDKDLPALLTPTKLNNMSANGTTPRFDVAQVMKNIMLTYFRGGLRGGSQAVRYGSFTTSGAGTANVKVIPDSTLPLDYYSTNRDAGGRVILFPLKEDLKKSYADDVIDDLDDKLKVILEGWQGATNMNECAEFCRQFIRTICDFFCGQGSMLDYFGYPIINHAIADRYADQMMLNFSGQDGEHTIYSWVGNPNYNRFYLSAPMVNEYPLRMQFCIWVEYYRNFDVEPLTNDFPDYHTWGSTPLTLDTLVQLLVTRPRSWSADPFISAGVDDISRHVFAPILQTNSVIRSEMPTASGGDFDATPIADKWSGFSASYLDSDGSMVSLQVPLPSGIMSAFSTYGAFTDVYGLELNTLRKAHMIENYLKRMYYGGDEYRDRMLSIYGSRIEDYRINRPELLSSSFDTVAVRQEVANTGAKPNTQGAGSTQVMQGDRLATATASTEGSDGFTSFSPEFGMYIGILSVMPKAQYDPLCMQLTMAKTFDFPAPQFANSMEETVQTVEMTRSLTANGSGTLVDFAKPFGFAPYAHAWRYRIDSVHGQYLDEKYDYSFARFWRADSEDNLPKLNHYFLHCHPRLDMFVNRVLLDGQIYGVGKHNFLVERTLPTPVETI